MCWDQIHAVGTEAESLEGISHLTGRMESWLHDTRSLVKRLRTRADIYAEDKAETPTGQTVQKMRETTRYGLFVWSIQNDPAFRRKVEALYEPKDGYVIRELGPTLAFVTGNELVRRPQEKTSFENETLSYQLDKVSARQNYHGNFMGKAAYEGAKAFIEEELNLHQLWNRLCRLIDRRKKFPVVPLQITEKEMAVLAYMGKRSSIPCQDGRFYLQSIESFSDQTLKLPLDALQNFEPEYRNQLVLHELGHLLTPRTPNNDFIVEALAWMHVYFYGKEHGQTWSQPSGAGVRTLYGTAGGLNPGEFAKTDAMGHGFHNALGHIACETMLQYMGSSTRQKLHNFRRIVAASQWDEHNEGRNEGNDTTHTLPSLSEWLCAIDVKGIQEMFEKDPFAQPLEDGKRVFWCETGKSEAGKSNWGVLYAFDIQKNQNFRYTKPRPLHIEPTMEEFDMNPGSATDLPLEVRICFTSGKKYDLPPKKGWMHIDPPTILRTGVIQNMTELHNEFSLEVKLPNGAWKVLGEHFYIAIEEASRHLGDLIRSATQNKPLADGENQKDSEITHANEIDQYLAAENTETTPSDTQTEPHIVLDEIALTEINYEDPHDVVFQDFSFPPSATKPREEVIDAFFADPTQDIEIKK